MPADREVVRRAMELLERDSELNDDVFTPPAAIGMGIDPGNDEGPETADVPRRPVRPDGAGGVALRLIEAEDNPWLVRGKYHLA